MADKFLINLRAGINPSELKNGSILVYDNKNDEFYTVTEKEFYDKYEKQLNALLDKYDEDFRNLRKEYNDFVKEIKEINLKLIAMVEAL